MRLRTPFSFVLLVVAFLVPVAASAKIPFFGPVIPPDYAVCAANWGMVIIVINNIISLAITLVITLVAPLMFTYAGFLLITSGGDTGARTKARKVFTNVIVGVVVALAAYLIIAALMAVLYHPSDPKYADKISWQDLVIWGGTPKCIDLAAGFSQNTFGGKATGVDSSGKPVLTFDPSAANEGACSAAKLRELVPSMTTAEANTFACLAKYESTCGTDLQNDYWNKPSPQANGKASTAYGAFQVLLSSNAGCYENTSCQQAAGITGPLNCAAGFGPKGFTEGGDPVVLERCKAAASNLSCSAAAAHCLYAQNGDFSDWTSDNRASGQYQCIAQFANQ